MNMFYKIKEKIVNFYKELLKEIKNIENKRKFVLIISMWVAAFVGIIVIAKVKNYNEKNVTADIQIKLEKDSSEEIITADISTNARVMKMQVLIQDEQTEANEKIKETEASVIETEVETTIEKETIPIQNIQVVEEQLKDDAVINIKEEVIYSEPGSTKSSYEIDKSRLVNCIDVSKHQGTIDWKAVKAAGIDYTFIRVAYRGYETGAIAKDSRFEENIKGALANGIEVGVYFFSQAVNEQEALEEASVILSYIKKYNITLPVVIDWETAPGYRTYSGIGKSKLTNIISVFCDTVEKNGYEPMVYMCQTDFTGRVDGKKLASKYKIWMAWYFECYANSNRSKNIFNYGDKIPDVTYRYDVWQYSKSGYVNGISTPVDMNIYILPEKKPDPVLTLSNNVFIANLNESKIDLKSGVTLIDSDGNDISDKVEYIIKDSQGKTKNLSEALSLSGKYSVYYSYSEYPDIYKAAVLYVRDVPEVYFSGELWNENEEKLIEYVYNKEISVDENISMITQEILNQIEAKCYYKIKEEGTMAIISNEYFEGLENIQTDGEVLMGEYKITYVATDDKGLSSSRNIVLLIKENINSSDETEVAKESCISSENIVK